MTVKIIAEIGVNHDGDPSKAHQLIDCAKRCGADAVKFQLFSARELEPLGERRAMLQGLELNAAVHVNLMGHAESIGLEYICTPFSVRALTWLVTTGVKTIKIGSGNNMDEDLLRAAALSECNVIMSTGMMIRKDLLASMKILGNATLLHCISAYPAPTEDMNLNAINLLQMQWPGCEVGLSDHSLSHTLPAAAVAMGATVIEKHLTLSRFADGPDHKASITPAEFRLMVDGIREVESALGDGKMIRPACEWPVMDIVTERRKYASGNNGLNTQSEGVP